MKKEVGCKIIDKINKRNKLKLISRDSLMKLIDNEIFLIMQPTFSSTLHQKNDTQKEVMYKKSKDALMQVSERRVNLILDFAECIVEKCQNFNNTNTTEKILFPVEFTSLTSDSHNGAQRPLLIKKTNGKHIILKFSDPRNYLATQHVMRFISEEIGIDLRLPDITVLNDSDCYFSDFLEEKEIKEYEIPEFMFGMGALTAVAFCMGFVDLHLENIVAVGKKPIIIDPECMLYNFAIGNSTDNRLWSTGLLSHNIHLSSLRGGISKSHPLADFRMHCSEGIIKYRRNVHPHRNKVRMQSGDFADPKNFKHDILFGYDVAYECMTKRKSNFVSLLENSIANDARIRYLARKTRHYTSVIYMLNLPSIYGDNWNNIVLSKLKNSGSFLDNLSPDMFQAEIHDISSRDVPYFWLKAGEDGKIYHSTGIVHDLRLAQSPKQQTIDDFISLGEYEKQEQKSIIESFLDIDIS